MCVSWTLLHWPTCPLSFPGVFGATTKATHVDGSDHLKAGVLTVPAKRTEVGCKKNEVIGCFTPLKSFEMICIPGIFLGSYQPLNLDLWSCPKSEKPRILSETPRTSTEACPENHWAVHGMVQKSNSFIWGLGINFRVFRHFSVKQCEARFWDVAEPQIVLFLDLFGQVWSFPG